MGKLSGTVLIVAGVALAASTLSARNRMAADVGAPRAGGEPEAAARPTPPDPPNREAKLARTAPQAALPAPPQPTTAILAPLAGKTADHRSPVTPKVVPPPTVRVAEAPARVPVGRNEPESKPALVGEQLTREIQRGLKRAGCYGGAITGDWNPSVRRAMKAFTDRANAALPVERPDQVLLALVESQRQVTCGASCPPGQAVAEDGRCLPSSLIALAKEKEKATEKPTPPQETRAVRAKPPAARSRPAPDGPAAVSTRRDPAPPPMGRMSLAGPSAEPSAERPPARARAPSWRSRRTTRHARPRPPPDYAETRPRPRRRNYGGYPVPPSFPWWALPAFMP